MEQGRPAWSAPTITVFEITGVTCSIDNQPGDDSAPVSSYGVSS